MTATDAPAGAAGGGRPVRLFGSDLDGTLLGNPEAAQRFRAAWEALPRGTRPTLVYATGRLVHDVRRIVESGHLPAPDWIIGGVGTQLHDFRRNIDLNDFTRHLSHGWALQKVRGVLGMFDGVQPQPAEFLSDFKSSWYLRHARADRIAAIAEALAATGLDVNVVYSSDRDLDIVPRAATKGGALRWLCEHLGVPLHGVLVAGDTGNDSSMFLLPGVRGIIPENGLPELLEATVHLRFFTSGEMAADGVLDGLRHYGVIGERPSAVGTAMTAQQMEPTFRMP